MRIKQELNCAHSATEWTKLLSLPVTFKLVDVYPIKSLSLHASNVLYICRNITVGDPLRLALKSFDNDPGLNPTGFQLQNIHQWQLIDYPLTPQPHMYPLYKYFACFQSPYPLSDPITDSCLEIRSPLVDRSEYGSNVVILALQRRFQFRAGWLR